MIPTVYRVAARSAETEDTTTLALEPVETAIAPPRPGQFCMLWAFGVGEAPISIAGTDEGQLIHTIRNVGSVTQALTEAEIGTQIGVRGPFGRGWELNRAEDGDALIVAGGLGLAPLRPLIIDLARRGGHGRGVVVVGARTPEDLLYRAELERWKDETDLIVDTTVDVASPDWRGNVGLVTQLLPAGVDPAHTTAYVCGPEIMMRFVARQLVDLGVREDAIYVSLERNMHCGIGHCGHCQLGPVFLCSDGPVLDWVSVDPLLAVPSR